MRYVYIYTYTEFWVYHILPNRSRKNSRADFHATNRHRGDSFPGFHARTGAHQVATAKNQIHNESVFDWKTAQNFQNHQNLQYEPVSTAWKLDSTQMSMWRARHIRPWRRMMHTYTGTFLLMFLVIFSAGFSYIMCAGFSYITVGETSLKVTGKIQSFSKNNPWIECMNFIYNQGSCESSGDFERCSNRWRQLALRFACFKTPARMLFSTFFCTEATRWTYNILTLVSSFVCCSSKNQRCFSSRNPLDSLGSLERWLFLMGTGTIAWWWWRVREGPVFCPLQSGAHLMTWGLGLGSRLKVGWTLAAWSPFHDFWTQNPISACWTWHALAAKICCNGPEKNPAGESPSFCATQKWSKVSRMVQEGLWYFSSVCWMATSNIWFISSSIGLLASYRNPFSPTATAVTIPRATCQGEMAGAWVSVHLRVGLCALPAPRVWELAGLGLHLSASIHRPWEEIASVFRTLILKYRSHFWKAMGAGIIWWLSNGFP